MCLSIHIKGIEGPITLTVFFFCILLVTRMMELRLPPNITAVKADGRSMDQQKAMYKQRVTLANVAPATCKQTLCVLVHIPTSDDQALLWWQRSYIKTSSEVRQFSQIYNGGI